MPIERILIEYAKLNLQVIQQQERIAQLEQFIQQLQAEKAESSKKEPELDAPKKAKKAQPEIVA